MPAAKCHVVVYANCQSGPLAQVLSLLNDRIQPLKIDPIHRLKPEQLPSVEEQFSRADVIVHQPVGSNFGGLGISALKKKFSNKRFISFPSLYFSGYFPNLMYLRKPGGGTLAGLIGDYHDQRVVQGFLDGASASQTVTALDNVDAAEGALALDESLATLRLRDQALDVPCTEFIEARFRQRKLFYVMNHPSREVLGHVALQVLRLLELQPKASYKGFESLPKALLSNYEVPVERSVVHAMGVHDFMRGIYSVRNEGITTTFNTEEFVAGCWRLYANTVDFGHLVAYAQERRKAMGV
jgi:hypothetical protein